MKLRAVLPLLAFSSAVLAAELSFDRPDAFPARAYELIADQRIVWFGEMHGTKEAPVLLLGLVKLVSAHSPAAPVVALEIPASDQATIDGFMASGDESILRASAFFKSEVKDGRSSQALVRLLADLRKETIATVVCFDPVDAETAQERDTKMAENLQKIAGKFPAAKLIVLSGNAHSRIVEGAEWDPTYRPAAFQLRQKIPSLVSFTIAFEAGTAWIRTKEGFGERQMRGATWAGTAPHYIALYPEPVRGHNGGIFTRALTCSSPW